MKSGNFNTSMIFNDTNSERRKYTSKYIIWLYVVSERTVAYGIWLNLICKQKDMDIAHAGLLIFCLVACIGIVVILSLVGDWGNQCALLSRTDCFWFLWTTPLHR